MRVGFTPLCPAGHLPHKEGDRLDANSSLYPQPLRWAGGFHESISPPVGEMPGRAEGASPNRQRKRIYPRTLSPFYHYAN
ncbi:lytic murein transglycosylase [Agrobacterium rosae]|nr:lytic murein transglycosylase [Agrobacterium rosae]